MLLIRPEQVEILEAAARSSFELTLMAHLRASYPRRAAAVDDRALHAFVRDAIAWAERCGFRTERHAARLAAILFALGEDAGAKLRDAGAAGLLDDVEFDADARLAMLLTAFRR